MDHTPKVEVKNSVVRVAVVALLLLVQLCWLLLLLMRLYNWSAIAQVVAGLLAVVLVLNVLGRNQNAAYKILWTFVLLALPVFGIFLFVLLEGSVSIHFARKRFSRIDEGLRPCVPPRPDDVVSLAAVSPVLANQARYLADKPAGIPAPLYRCEDVRFYAEAADGFAAQLTDIETARDFVFLEYHAIQDSVSFARLKALLARKVTEGVEVRIIYDDMGSFGFISRAFIEGMEAIGVQCRVFNPLVPVLSVLMNNRDHRKITVVDGRVGFTGGYNLADEYFNITHPFGQWKDTGLRLIGDPVRSLTAMFLEMWNAIDDTDHSDYARYLPVSAAPDIPATGTDSPNATGSCQTDGAPASSVLTATLCMPVAASRPVPEPTPVCPGAEASAALPTVPSGACPAGEPLASVEGWVQPYCDSPLDDTPTAEDVYLNMIKGATQRLWATTPYLIITDEMTRELTLAARRGVDVRIVTPGIPDKKTVYKLTRSYYAQLARHGVRIYEWTPGFIHAKQMLADDQVAACGTINLDYRSLYLHFENGCVLYRCPALTDIAADFEHTFAQAAEVTDLYADERIGPLKLGRRILRLLAPLL